MATKSFFLCIFLFLNSVLISQKHEVIVDFQNGKSLKGLGKMLKKGVKFQLNSDSPVQVYPYEDLSQLIITSNEDEDIIYRYVQLKENKKPKMIILLVEGPVSLYKEIRGKGHPTMVMAGSGGPNFVGGSTTYYHVKKESEDHASQLTSLWLPVTYFKNHSIEYFSDCPELVKKIKNKEFKQGKVKEMVTYYNTSCNR